MSSPSPSQHPIFSSPVHPPVQSHPPVHVQPAPVPLSSSRRLPPPCWSDHETVALIEVYRDKWYSLRRGNLRAPDWEHVAVGVAARCRNGNDNNGNGNIVNGNNIGAPPKTSIQCRHKMEKLRKRYRAEIQRIGSDTKRKRYLSSWVHFKLMHSMELGVSVTDPSLDEDEDDEKQSVGVGGIGIGIGIPIDTRNRVTGGSGGLGGSGGSDGMGVRIKIPSYVSRNNNGNNNNMVFDDLPPPVNPRYVVSGMGSRNGYMKEGVKRKEEDGNVLDEMVVAIQKLGDGFVRMEKMKMDMVRELETMRMKAEMKHMERMLEMQRKLWESFSEMVMEKKSKKVKRMPTPPEL